MLQQSEEQLQEPEDVVVLALAQGCSNSEAASRANIHRATVGRWLQNPEFCQRVTAERRNILDRAIGKVSDRVLLAVDTLCELLQSESESVRLGAAKCLLSNLLPLDLRQNLEERIAQLENAK